MNAVHILPQASPSELGYSKERNKGPLVINVDHEYVLKTGFGKSEESYGGTKSSLNSGLGQGSRASPLVFMALGSIIVDA
jgi:hypothetical protein